MNEPTTKNLALEVALKNPKYFGKEQATFPWGEWEGDEMDLMIRAYIKERFRIGFDDQRAVSNAEAEKADIIESFLSVMLKDLCEEIQNAWEDEYYRQWAEHEGHPA